MLFLEKCQGSFKNIKFWSLLLVSVHSMGKCLSTRGQVQFFLTGGKRRYYASK